MKTRVINAREPKKYWLNIETREERTERIHYASAMQTRVHKSKKAYNRREFKKFDFSF